MRLVPADELTDQDRAMQQVLIEHPDLKHQLTILLNGYRELLARCVVDLYSQEMDTADLVISCAKKDQVLKLLGIPLLNTPQEWENERLKHFWTHLPADEQMRLSVKYGEPPEPLTDEEKNEMEGCGC